MKFKRIAALSICALVLGAAIGLVGNQKATETMASESMTAWFITGNIKGNWHPDNRYRAHGEAGRDDKAVYRNLEFVEGEEFIIAFYYDKDAALTPYFDWNGASRFGDVVSQGPVTGFVDAGGSDHNIKCVKSGTYDIFFRQDNKIEIVSQTIYEYVDLNIDLSRVESWGEDVYLYAWKDAETVTEKNAEWPGVKITGNQYKFNATKWDRLIINDGKTENAKRTRDIDLTSRGESTTLYVANSQDENKYRTSWSAPLNLVDGYYFAGTANSWTPTAADLGVAPMSLMPIVQWSSVPFDAGDEFKIRKIKGGITYDDEWFGYSSIVVREGDAHGKFDVTTGDKIVAKEAASSSSFDIYFTESGQLYIFEDVPAERIDDDGYLYISSGSSLQAFVYSWTEADPNHHVAFTENAPYPGVKLENPAPGLNFNGAGSIYKLAANTLYKNLVVSLWSMNGETRVSEEYKTSEANPLQSQGEVYVNATHGGETVLEKGAVLKQAKAAYDLATAIGGTALHSVCELSQPVAAELAAAYAGLGTDKDLFDTATIYTYNGVYDEDDMPTENAYFSLSAIMAEVMGIADSATNLSWNISEVSSKASDMVWAVITFFAIGLATATAMYLISRKRRHQK